MGIVRVFQESQSAGVVDEQMQVPGGSMNARPFWKRRSAQVAMVTLALAGSLAVWHLLSAQQLDAELGGLTLHTNDTPLVNGVTLTIHNTSQQTVTPRLAVQNGSWQPYPWTIESGPRSLAPGERGFYRISTDLPYRMLNAEQGGQIIATDASGNYRPRATIKIQPDPTFLDPNAVFNANYLHVDGPSPAPRGWAAAGPGQPAITYQMLAQNFTAIELSLNPAADQTEWAKTVLYQTILMPEGDLVVWVRPPSIDGSDEELSTAYGVEFYDGQNMLWVLFGPSDDEGYLDSHHYYTFIPAEPLTRSEQRIDLRGIYEGLGWPLPPLRQMRRNDLQMLARPISMRLLLAGRGQQPGVTSAQFGPVTVDVAERASQHRVTDTIAHRWEYYFILSDLSAAKRNEYLADTYFAGASREAPAGAGDFVLGERAFSNGDYDAAIAYFERAIAHDYRTAEARRGIGWSLLARGDLDEAERYFTAALADNAVFADAHAGLGSIWFQRGQCDRAVRYGEQALAISPDASGARQILEACSAR